MFLWVFSNFWIFINITKREQKNINRKKMAKIVKLKQSDLENVIGRVLKEQMDNPESQPRNKEDSDENYGEGEELKLGQDQFGNYYIFDEDGNIIEKT